MRIGPFLVLFCAWLLPSAASGAPVGFIDGISAAGLSGWACVPGNPAPVSIAIVAGDRLLGVYPETATRADVARICGTMRAGFAIGFDRATQDQLVGEPSLSAFALAPFNAPLPLQGSNPAAYQPYRLPLGSLVQVAGGLALGDIAGPGSPRLSVYAGAPAADGGLAGGAPLFGSAPGGVNVAAPLPVFTPPPGAALPVFGYAPDQAGAPVPLAHPVPAAAGAASLPIGGTVAQSGSLAGIRDTVFTAWIPAGQGFAGVSGKVALTGNAPGFSEALALLGTTTDDPASCARRNGLAVSAPPAMARLWAGILKNTGASTVTIPVNLALPYPVTPVSPAGSCAVLLISAGYPYLSPTTPLYTTASAALTMATAPATAGAPQVVPLGLGGEFRIASGTSSAQSVLVGLQALVPLELDAIAGALSTAPVVGAPAASGWLPIPAGNWAYETSFLYLPAAICAGLGLAAHPANGLFAMLRQGNPGSMTVPAGSVPLMRVGVESLGGLPIQKSTYQAFTATVPAATPFRLGTGDCLIGLGSSVPSAGGTPGMLDVEDQSTVYLRVSG